MRRMLPVLLALVLTPLAACGDDDAPEEAARSTTTAARREDDLCAHLDDDGLDEVRRLVPAEHRDAVDALERFGDRLQAAFPDSESEDGAGETTPVDAAGLADGLAADRDDLAALAGYLEDTCGRSDPASYAVTAADIVAAEPVDEYCAALAASFGGEDQPDLAALRATAPASHRAALDDLAAIADATEADAPDEAEVGRLATSMIALGLYAEARCGADGSLAAAAVASAFLSMGAGTETNPGTVDEAPPAADSAAATDLLPGSTDLTFEVRTVVLDEDSGRSASVVVPVGWETGDMIGVSFDPPVDAGLGLSTEMSVDDDCDGMCEATDWEARLRGKDGYLSNYLANLEDPEERAPSEGDGVVVTGGDGSGGSRAIVVRWDDTVDHYFRCAVEVDERAADLLPALTAACEAARPNWFPIG